MTKVPSDPRELGLNIASYRPGQREATQIIADQFDAGARVMLADGPTGSGKSAIAMSLSKLFGYGGGSDDEGSGALILTKTLHLQDQYKRDYPELSVIKGRSNFPCLVMPGTTADRGPCTVGWKCPERKRCPYYVQRDVAANRLKQSAAATEPKQSAVAVTNYSYYIADNISSGILPELGILILDEAHLAPDQITSSVEILLDWKQLSKIKLDDPKLGSASVAPWQKWGNQALAYAEAELERLMPSSKDDDEDEFTLKLTRKPSQIAVERALILRRLIAKLRLLSVAQPRDWMITQPKRDQTLMRPVWSRSLYHVLMGKAQRILVMSATLHQEELTYQLGIDILENNPAPVIEIASQFDPASRPFIVRPQLAVKGQELRANQQMRREMAASVDSILEANPWKGIIHTHSYDVADAVLENTRNRGRMLTIPRDATPLQKERIFQLFISSTKPLVLVGPNFAEGVDLPDDLCRFQIICKLPFADMGDEMVARKMKERPSWYAALTADAIVQSYGRAMRSSSDWGRTYCIDANFVSFYRRNTKLFPKWFRDAVVFTAKEELFIE